MIYSIIALFIFNHTAFARDFSNVTFKATSLSPSITLLQGEGGNIGISAGEDGVFIIDDQFAELNERIRNEIKKINNSPIRFVINTHWHGDHTGGNELFSKSGTVIIAHNNVRKRMSVENFNKILNRKTEPSPSIALPVVTFPDQMSIHMNGESAQMIHFKNGHTDGDIIVHFPKSNVIHTGDLFFNGFYPFIDVDSHGSLDGIIKATQKIIKMSNSKTKIIPGHGPLANRQDLKNYLNMLLKVKSLISPLITQGKTLDEIIKLDPLKSLNPKWGGGFMKPEIFTKVVYRSLSGK